MSAPDPYPLRLWAYRMGRDTLGFFCRLRLTFEAEGVGHVPEGPCIVASNHASHLDPPLLGIHYPRPLRFLAKRELFKGLMGSAMRLWGQIPVDRGRGGSGAVRVAKAALEAGWDIGLFVEGTRSRDGLFRRSRCKTGVATLAHLTGVNVVPAALVGTFDAYPPGAKLPRRANVLVRFGPPLRDASFLDGPLNRDTANEFTSKVADAIEALLPASQVAQADQG